MSPLLRHQRAFTLLELLVVITLIGIAAGLVSLSVSPSQDRLVNEEIARLQALFRVAQDTARVSGRTLVWSADTKGYQFAPVDPALARNWNDEVLRARTWPFEVRGVRVQAATEQALQTMRDNLRNEPDANASASSRILFGREPLLQPMLLQFDLPDKSVVVQLDALGNLAVLPAPGTTVANPANAQAITGGGAQPGARRE